MELKTIILGIAVAMCLTAIIIVFAIIDYKRSMNKPDKKPSLLTRTIILSFAIILIIVIIKTLNGQKLTKNDMWVFLAIMILMLLVNYYELRRFKPLSWKQLKSRFLSQIAEMYDAVPLELSSETNFGHSYPFFKITKLTNKNGFLDVVANSVVKTNQGMILIKQDVFDGYPAEVIHDPPFDLVEEIYGTPLAEKYDEEREKLVHGLDENGAQEEKQD